MKRIQMYIISLLGIMFLSTLSYGSNPFGSRNSFETKKEGDVEISTYDQDIKLDQLQSFENFVSKYLSSLGYNNPIGIKLSKENVDKFIYMEEFLHWKNGEGDRVTMIIHKSDKPEFYTISFKVKSLSSISPRYRN